MPTPTEVPVREAIDEVGELLRRLVRPVIIHAVDDYLGEEGQLRKDPAIQESPFPDGTPLHRQRIELVDGGVNREEGINVPELQRELPLKRSHIAERVPGGVPRWIGTEEKPTESIRARCGRLGVFKYYFVVSGKPRDLGR